MTLSELARKRWYIQVAPLLLDSERYTLGAPWSNQVVAGQQILSDDRAPQGQAQLYRPSTTSVVSSGVELYGYVGTYYDLQTQWADDTLITESWIDR